LNPHGCYPTRLAGNEHKPVSVCMADNDGLQDATLPHRFREFVEGLRVEVLPGLFGIGIDDVDRDIDDCPRIGAGSEPVDRVRAVLAGIENALRDRPTAFRGA